jgi:hypothetical protein
MDAEPIFVGDGHVDAARTLVAEAEDAELFLHPGDQHYFPGSSLPSYEPFATALLVQRVLDFLDRHEDRAPSRSSDCSPPPGMRRCRRSLITRPAGVHLIAVWRTLSARDRRPIQGRDAGALPGAGRTTRPVRTSRSSTPTRSHVSSSDMPDHGVPTLSRPAP